MIKIGHITLPDKPLLLAPMEDVSSYPFRKLCKKFGADLMFTEFVSADALTRKVPNALKKTTISPDERPIAIQIYGKTAEAMAEAAKICSQMGADIIDINFGCPVKKIACKGAGSGLLQDIPNMLKITEAVVRATHLPVTAKTRLSWDGTSVKITTIAPLLQELGIQALTIHGRTRMQLYKGEANWDLIREVKENPRIKIPIFGNGDVRTPQGATEAFEKYKVDGVMIGRAAIGKPWIFQDIKDYWARGRLNASPKLETRIGICLEHMQNMIEWKGPGGVLAMRSHYSGYFKEIANSKQLKIQLMQARSLEEVEGLLTRMLSATKEY